MAGQRRTAQAVDGWLRAADAAELEPIGMKTVSVGGRTLVLWRYEGQVFALDNRCPHMGFPLDRGSLRDGIVSCHWHNARFDLKTGGTFDQFADDVQVFPAEERDGAIWVDVERGRDERSYYRKRLADGCARTSGWCWQNRLSRCLMAATRLSHFASAWNLA